MILTLSFQNLFYKREKYMNKNFILPETEKALNIIIAKISLFFNISILCFYVFYAAYSLLRIFFMKEYFVPNIILSVISCCILALSLLEFFNKVKFNRNIHLFFEVLKRLVPLFIFILAFISLFSSYDKLLPYKVLATMFCGLGLILSALNDIFKVTIPVWTKEILESFKADIEILGLAKRSLNQLKEEVKATLKKSNADNLFYTFFKRSGENE